MSDSQARLALARYRPLFYLLSGVAAAYALVYLRNQLFSSTSQAPIRRQNAVRRRRRQGLPQETPSVLAITHLEQLEAQSGVYGTFRIETEDGRRVESGLLPSLLATRDQLMEEVGVPESHAERMREMMEDTFLESFFALDFPAEHIIEAESQESEYLVQQLQNRGISRSGIERAIARFNADPNYGEELRRRRHNGERVTLSTSAFADEPVPMQSLEGVEHMDARETVDDDQSHFSWREADPDTLQPRQGQNLLNLLYHIAEDQARKDGYIHRGVTCNSCGAMPIQGIRYRCANCIDYDLCETCESMQVHIKTHLFYKVRIPAPFLGNPRQSQPVWYPGKPSMLPRTLPRNLVKRLGKETSFEGTELEALWDQFRCLANREWLEDPAKLFMAIDRKTFDRCFVPNTSARPPPPSLIYDRMFAFYDTNNDGLIGFEEFLKGLASLNNKSNDERLRRVFRGYDIDGDGFVERKDFLRVFRAYYTLSRELTRDMVAGMEDDFLEGGARDVVLGSQPISSAFPGSIPPGEVSRTGEGKRVNRDGDMEIADNEGILRADGADTGNRHSVVGEAAVRRQFGRTQPLLPVSMRLGQASSSAAEASGSRRRGTARHHEGDVDDHDDETDTSSVTSDHWPPAEHILEEDIVNALGSYVPLQDITDPDDRARIGTAVYNRMCDSDQRRVDSTRRHGIDERWRRRAFYTDEEDGGVAPDGYLTDSDLDDDDDDNEDEDAQVPAPEYESQPPSPRSRSSSKVRFQDDLTDVEDDYEDVRSNPSTSSRSILVGERWGGFEVPEVERDVGKEILYQTTQQGFNEILDLMFKPKEDLLMECYRTRTERKMWAREIELAEQMEAEAGDTGREDVQSNNDLGDEGGEINEYREQPLHELLARSGYSVGAPAPESVGDGPVLPPPPSELRLPESDDESSSTEDNDSIRPTHLANPEEADAAEPSSHSIMEPRDSLVLSPTPHPHSFPALDGASFVSLDHHIDSHFDFTLPQHRPESEFDIENPILASLPPSILLRPNNVTSTFPAPPSLSPSSPEAEATAPKRSPSPIQPLPSPSRSPSPRLQPNRQGPTTPPPPATLSRWAYLNRIEEESKERGGTGAKLNFEEFSRRMAADRGRRLAFVASWIEMASF